MASGSEIKLLYRKEQHLNQRLYCLHVEGAHNYNGMWQHTGIYTYIYIYIYIYIYLLTYSMVQSPS